MMNWPRSGSTLVTWSSAVKMYFIERSWHRLWSFYLWSIIHYSFTPPTIHSSTIWLFPLQIQSCSIFAVASLLMESLHHQVLWDCWVGWYQLPRNVRVLDLFALITTNTYILSELGDPVDDLSVATVLMMVGGQLVLLRPRKVRELSSMAFLQIITPKLLVCRPGSEIWHANFCWSHWILLDPSSRNRSPREFAMGLWWSRHQSLVECSSYRDPGKRNYWYHTERQGKREYTFRFLSFVWVGPQTSSAVLTFTLKRYSWTKVL